MNAESNGTHNYTIPEPLLKKILKRQLVLDITHALAKRQSPFHKDEALVMIGSAGATIEGATHTGYMPLIKPPSDMDVMLYEPHGEEGRPRTGAFAFDRLLQKASKSTIVENLLEETADDLHVAWRRFEKSEGETPETIGSQIYRLKKSWTPQKINAVLQSPATKVLINQIAPNQSPLLKLSSYNGPAITTPLDVHLITYPFSFLPPRPLEGMPHNDKSKVHLMADDDLNIVAVKLVRLMVAGDETDRYAQKTTGLIDIHDILRQRQARHEPPIDTDLLRLMVLAHISKYNSLNYKDDIESASAMKLEPTVANIEAVHADLKASDSDSRVTKNQVETMLTEAYRLIKDVFPTVSQANPLPLSHDDKVFIGLVRGRLGRDETFITRDTHPAISGIIREGSGSVSYRFQRPHLAGHRLSAGHPQEMEKMLEYCPDFLERFARHSMVRPVNEGMDAAARADLLVPRGRRKDKSSDTSTNKDRS